MSNINFDNPWLLLLLIPFVLIVAIPFFVALKKDNLNIHNVGSLVCHLILCVLITLVIAKTTYEKVITETNVYVLADCSYSSNQNLDKLDKYIDDLEDNLPKNSKMGIICFGKDYELLTDIGEPIRSVTESKVDQSATNITKALEYAASLFTDDVIKRIVIISDGKETNDSNIVSVISGLSQENIYIDAIYLDNNIPEDTPEVQINSVDFTKSTYLNSEQQATVLVQSSVESDSILTLNCNDNLVSTKYVKLVKGFNTINVDLDTSNSGEFNYEINIKSAEDTSSYNDSYLFTQKIDGKAKVLFISKVRSDEAIAKELYGEDNELTMYINETTVPFKIEQLCLYDEIVLSNINISELKNSTEFVKNLDIVVAEFGKSLITLGNVYIQSTEDNAVLDGLSSMLPIKYGNDDKDTKLVTIVIDISNSMTNLSRLAMAQEAAYGIIDLLNDEDEVAIVSFFGEIKIVQQPTSASNREELKEIIKKLSASQGTYLGSALYEAYDLMKDLPHKKKEIMLLSDGKPYGEEIAGAKAAARDLIEAGITISTLNTFCNEGIDLLKDISIIGKGKYYYAEDLDDLKQIVLNDMADDITDTVIEDGEYEVKIKKSKDEIMEDIDSLSNINGFYFGREKANATTVLTTSYVSAHGREYVVPLYSYWNYGNGRVTSFGCDLSTGWINDWHNSDSNGYKFLSNITDVNKPKERINTPFIFDVTYEGTNAQVTVTAPSLNNNSKLELQVTLPNGVAINKVLAFDSQNYITSLDVSEIGKYVIKLGYTLGEYKYESEYVFNISYSPEYNSFQAYEASNLYYMVSNNGQISENGELVLENDNSFIRTYTYDFTLLFMIISVIVFVIDIIIRKLKLEDIKSLFKKKQNKDITK